MSGQQIGTVVGTIAGFWLPGGPQVWGAIGGVVGGYISPTVLKGPSIGDAQTQTSMAGMPIPKCYGRTPPIAPTVIDGDKIARKVIRKQGGKGSSTVTEQEGFIATRAFLVCEGEIAGYARIHRNGKLVYSTVPGDALDAETSSFAAQITIYTGSETQGPDPSLEALHGVGNTPHYPGRSYFVVRDDDETQTGGAANQYRVEVAACGDFIPGTSTNPLAAKAVMWLELDGGNTTDGFPDIASPSEPALWYHSTAGDAADFVVFGPALYGNGVSSAQFLPGPGSNFTCARTPNNAMNAIQAEPCAYAIWFRINIGSLQSRHSLLERNAETSSSFTSIRIDNATGHVDVSVNFSVGGAQQLDFTSVRTGLCDNGSHHLILNYTGTHYELYIDGGLDKSVAHAFAPSGTVGGTSFIGSTGQGGEVTDGYLAQAIWFADSLTADDIDFLYNLGEGNNYYGTTGLPLPDAPAHYVDIDGNLTGPSAGAITHCTAQWNEIAEDIAGRSHRLLPAQLDIDHMTDEVPGFVLGNATLTGTDYMRTLCSLYFVDGSEYDNQWHAVRRGGAIVGTLDEDDLLTVEKEDDDTRDQALKGFKRVTVMYPDPANNYVPTPQTAPRTSPDVTANNEITIECPIPFDADTMAQKADILQKIAFLQLEGSFKRNLRAQYSQYVTSDPVVFKDRRYILNKIAYDDSMVRFEGTYDRVSAYTSLAAGNSGPTPEPQRSNLKGPTIFAAMNLPRLRTEDNVPGMYVAVCGILDGWPGADLYISTDDGASEQFNLRLTNQATIGVLAADCTASSEPITVKLYPHGELVTVTPEQIAARQNAFAITTGAVSEVGQFQTATEDMVTAQLYDLTDTIRGELGTVAAPHYVDDQVVMLESNVYFIRLDASLIGQTIRFHPVTIGTAPANNPYYDVVFDPQFTGPEVIDFLETNAGDRITTDDGSFIQVTHE